MKHLCFFLTMLFSCAVANTNAQGFSEATEEEEINLSPEELEAFKQQAVRSVTDLGTYIKIIIDKANSIERRNINIGLAMALFATDSIIVEITSLKNGQKYVKRIRKYLTAVRDLPYQSADITWYGIHLSSEFTKGKDGKYYGTASICQTFEAKALTTDGAKWPTKRDVTCKNIQLIVEYLECLDGLEKKKCWILKLGDIKVDEQRLN